MTWLTWRQFRIQALTGLGALLLLAIHLVILAEQIRHSQTVELGTCVAHGTCGTKAGGLADQYATKLNMLSYSLVAVPGVIGIFWGAPLITRELEGGTHRLVWNQSITRAAGWPRSSVWSVVPAWPWPGSTAFC